MVKMKNLILLILIVLILIFNAAASPVVSVIPSSMDIKVGDTFTVNVSVDPGGIEILGAQFDLNYDSSKLNATAISKGIFLTQDGRPSMIAVRSCRINIDQCNYGETRIGVKNGISTPGTLAIITFKVQDAGEVSFQVDDMILSDRNASMIPNVIYHNAVVKIQSPGTGGIRYGNYGTKSSESNSNIEIKEVLTTTTVVEAPNTLEIPIESPNKKVGGFNTTPVMIIITMIFIFLKR